MLGSSYLGTFGSRRFGLRGLSPLDPTLTSCPIWALLARTELRYTPHNEYRGQKPRSLEARASRRSERRGHKFPDVN